jgi:hypothetical protein
VKGFFCFKNKMFFYSKQIRYKEVVGVK